MLRKLSALFFLLVMTMLIGLHSPVFGYCPMEDAVFVGGHLTGHLTEPDGHHDCGHDEVPDPLPCDEDHEFLTVDAGDFQWSSFHFDNPPVVLSAEDFVCEPLVVLPTRRIFGIDLPEYVPPPPGLPIFRRHGVLRL